MDIDPSDQALMSELESEYPFVFGGGNRDVAVFVNLLRQLRDKQITEVKHQPADASGFNDYPSAVQAMKDMARNFLDDTNDHHFPELETYYKLWNFMPQCTLAILVMLGEEGKDRIIAAKNKVGVWQKWGDKFS